MTIFGTSSLAPITNIQVAEIDTNFLAFEALGNSLQNDTSYYNCNI